MEKKEKTLGSRMLHDEIHSLRSQQDNTRQAQREAEQEASNTRSRAEGLERELRDANTQVETLNNEVNGLTEELETTQKSLRNVEQQASRTHERLMSTEKALSASTRERDGIQSLLSQTSKELEKFKIGNENMTVENESLTSRVADLEQQVVEAAEDAGALTKERRRETHVMLEKIASLETERDNLKKFSGEMKTRLEGATTDGEDLVAQLKGERSARENFEQLYNELTEERRNEESSISSVRNSMQNAVSSAETKVSGLEAQVRNLEGRLNRTTNEKSVVESSVVALTSEVESIRRTLSQAVDDVCSRYGSSNPAVGDFIRKRSESLATPRRAYTPSKSVPRSGAFGTPARHNVGNPAIDGVRETVRSITSLVQMTATHGVSSESQLQSSESELEQLRTAREQVFQLEGEVQTMRLQLGRNGQLEGRLRSSEQEVAELRNERNSETQLMRQEINYLKNQTSQLQTMEQELRRNEMERAAQTERCSQLQQLVDRLRSEKTAVNDNLQTVDSKVHNLQKNIAAVESDLVQCRSDLASARSQASLAERRTADFEQRKKMLEQQLEAARSTINDQRNQIQQLQHTQSQMENEISTTLNTLQIDYQRSMQEKDRVGMSLRTTEQDLDAANLKLRSLESLRMNLESQNQKTVREKEDALNAQRRTENQLEAVTKRCQVMERERDALATDLQSVQSDAVQARGQIQELRQREFQIEQEFTNIKLENSRLQESKLDLARQLERSRKSIQEQRELDQAQIGLLQSKVGGLENTLSSIDGQKVQKDLAIMELSQSLRRVEHAISPPRPSIQTPGATPMMQSFGSSGAYRSSTIGSAGYGNSYNSMPGNYFASAQAKLASMRSGAAGGAGDVVGGYAASASRPTMRIHRTGSVTVGMPPSVESAASSTADTGVTSLQDRLKNVQETFALLRSGKKAPPPAPTPSGE